MEGDNNTCAWKRKGGPKGRSGEHCFIIVGMMSEGHKVNESPIVVSQMSKASRN